MRHVFLAFAVLGLAVLAGCGGGGSSGGSAGGGGTGGTGGPGPTPAPELGSGDHTPSSVTFTTLSGTGLGVSNPADLAFSPVNANELWIVSQGDMNLVIIDNVLAATLTGERINSSNDGNWSHFFSNASGIAMGAQTSSTGNGWTFATSQDSNNGGNNFMGPTLWSLDRNVLGHYPPGVGIGLGSHLDMLHSTRYAKGIAHESANIYWTVGQAFFTVNAGTPQVCISRYNFFADHGPGADNHANGVKWHYARGQVATVTGVPLGMHYHSGNKLLYVSDTGNGRVIALDTQSGNAPVTVTSFTNDGIDYEVTGATVTNIVAPGTHLTQPSGLEYRGGLLYVCDHATGIIHAFDLSGNRVNWLDTGLGSNALTGLAFGPDGKLYFCDIKNDRVVRIDP
ncbi:MAG: hypothetical protein KF696_06605 [Planctomycetes bacterium]|nr:hypothetical protein [Planctomycetota bacterium]MCW8137204.1 hypothetical protein [Planctomycetota bacterium]